MEARIKAGLWVKASLRLADMAGRSGAVLRRGDADSGGVLVVLRGRDGLIVLSQARGAGDAPVWLRATGESPVPEQAADAQVARQVARDPDLWVLEFESPDYQLPFEGRIA